MTMTNAVKGLKHVIQHREELIKGLDDLTKGWEDDCAKAMVNSSRISWFMTLVPLNGYLVRFGEGNL